VQAATLFSTTKEGWAMRENFITSPEVPYMLEREAAETKGAKILGASLSGIFPSFFADLEKPIRYGSDEELPDMPVSASISRIIVVGDTDFATNIIDATQGYHNLDFLIRAADWLSSDEDIIGIRSRQPQTGRLDKIMDTDARVAAMRFSQILNVVIVPLLVIIAGLYLAYRRKIRAGGSL
jgi:ABC-type uncharacterized transport system involved in gliding motility auxiliary subunit